MADQFPCEACGHPLNRHDPCNDVVGKKSKPCTCPAFAPADLKLRLAGLTDHRHPTAAELIAQLPR